MKRPLHLITMSLALACCRADARMYEEAQPALADQQQAAQHPHLTSATITEVQQVRPNVVDDQHRSLQVVNSQGPWPECMGISGEDCKKIIEAANPEMTVYVSHPQKFNYYRVWINIDENGVVVGKPGRG